MGGLRKDLRITFVCMLIVALSLAGIFPFSGFWSKDAILTATLQAGGLGADLLYVLGLATALATAFYSMRMIGLIFYGKKSENIEKIEHHEVDHGVHEAPRSMWIPYSILAGATIVIGVLAPFFLESKLGNLFSGYLSQWGINSPYTFDLSKDALSLGVGLSVALVGLLIGYLAYIRRSINLVSIVESNRLIQSFHTFFVHRWYINAFYYKLFVYPVQKGSLLIFNSFEKKVIDPINIGATNFGGSISDALKKIQTGVEEEYLLAFGIGIVMLVILLFAFGAI